MMTIDQMISMLEDYRQELGGDAEVRLMTQPSWPFENAIFGMVSGHEINGSQDDEDDEDRIDDEDVEEDGILYICEGEQLGYGSKRAWEER